MKRLQDKVALVTGGGQGLGKAIALRLASEGASVVVDYVGNPAPAQEVLKEIEAAGAAGHAVEADVSKVPDVQRMIAAAVERFGKLDVLVNNAGVEKNVPFWDVTEAEYDFVLDINLKGVFFGIQAFVRHLRETGRKGKVINISSVHEELPFPHFASYCASKGGVKMLTRTLAIELAPLGVTLNSIAPGAFVTPINTALLHDKEKLAAVLQKIPLGRLGQPEDVAGLAAFLASAEADYITGTTYTIDGGLTWNYQEQ
ncbi:MAG TPA: glucose 1-dehydrogenase [Chloroflexota bacterium]|nr:glucose 1-dehydrogenase [Chloroflexota bacterium]